MIVVPGGRFMCYFVELVSLRVGRRDVTTAERELGTTGARLRKYSLFGNQDSRVSPAARANTAATRPAAHSSLNTYFSLLSFYLRENEITKEHF